MSLIEAKLTRQYMPEYSENLVPVSTMYNGANTFITESTGTSTVSAINSNERRFEGEKSLRVEITNVSATSDEVTVYDEDDTVTAEYNNLYPFSFRLFDTSTAVQPSGVVMEIDFYKNGLLTPFFTVKADTDSASVNNFRVREWNCFTADIPINIGEVVTWKYRFLPMSLLSNPILYVDGVKLELRDRELGLCSTYSKSKYL